MKHKSKDAAERRPRFEDLELFHHVGTVVQRNSKTVQGNSKTSYATLAESFGCAKLTITNAIERLESCFKEKLIRTQGQRAEKGVTAKGNELLKLVGDLLEQYERITKWNTEDRQRLNIGVTNALLVHTLPDPVHKFLGHWEEPLQLTFVEAEYPALLEAVRTGQADFAVGPQPKSGTEGVEIRPLKRAFQPVAICSRNHPWSTTGRRRISIDDFADQRLLILPEEVQPNLFERIPTNESAGGQRIPMQNYTSIIACVLLNIGVSIVPGIFTKLYAQEDINCLALTGLGKITVETAVYLPMGGIEVLSEPAAVLLEIIEEHMKDEQRQEERRLALATDT